METKGTIGFRAASHCSCTPILGIISGMSDGLGPTTSSAMYDLDRPETYSSLDPSGIRGRLRELPRHCEEAWRVSQAIPLPLYPTPVQHVVIGGMGGSAIAGDLTSDLAAAQSAVPISVVRDSHLGFALNPGSLFIACSYSGETQETLSMFHQALAAGSQVMVISSGGRLSTEAQSRGIPILKVDAPGEPRNATTYSLLLLLGALHRLDLVRTGDDVVRASAEDLRKRVAQLEEDVPTRYNPAKLLAAELKDKLILVYGGGFFTGMARRWKTQLNENAKVWAFFETIPELLHNAVESYGNTDGPGGQLMVLLLQPWVEEGDADPHYQVVSQLLRRNAVLNRILQGETTNPLSQLLAMLLLGDYVSYYLALLRGVDPSPTLAIQAAKEGLARLLPEDGN